MANPEFVHLHVHTAYSLLDGAIRVKDLKTYIFVMWSSFTLNYQALILIILGSLERPKR
jgi:DNA polymerase III alpha subunit